MAVVRVLHTIRTPSADAGAPNRLGVKGDGRSDSARGKVGQYKPNPLDEPFPGRACDEVRLAKIPAAHMLPESSRANRRPRPVPCSPDGGGTATVPHTESGAEAHAQPEGEAGA